MEYFAVEMLIASAIGLLSFIFLVTLGFRFIIKRKRRGLIIGIILILIALAMFLPIILFRIATVFLD